LALGNQLPSPPDECIVRPEPTQGTETSKYLQERKSTETPLVAASESGTAQTPPYFTQEVDMFYVYILLEINTGRTYIGYTNDLKRRVAQHKAGNGCQTTRKGNWKLVYYEAFAVKEDATKREYKLKHHGMTKRKLFERLSKSLAG
jgi:putative endonuclease